VAISPFAAGHQRGWRLGEHPPASFGLPRPDGSVAFKRPTNGILAKLVSQLPL